MAGNSQPSGPKRGVTIKEPSVLLNVLEYVHKVVFPRDESQEALTMVNPW